MLLKKASFPNMKFVILTDDVIFECYYKKKLDEDLLYFITDPRVIGED